jgi:P2-related tail formation protein
MPVNANILPPIVSANPHLRAFVEAGETILNQNDLTVLLVYIVDIAPVSVLPYLAAQFQVLGAGGWQYADTEAKQRSLLKSGLKLNRTKGTIFAIKEALKFAGFGDATINEGDASGAQIICDGTYFCNGFLTADPANHLWAFFSIEIELNGQPNNAETLAKATNTVLEYKNARSKLTTLTLI